jgi:hypothetical protein
MSHNNLLVTEWLICVTVQEVQEFWRSSLHFIRLQLIKNCLIIGLCDKQLSTFD